MKSLFLALTIGALSLMPINSARSEVVATLVARVIINAGETRTSPAIAIPLGSRSITVSLNVLAADWDDPLLLITTRAELSRDGGLNWETFSSDTFVGGSRSRDGSFPSSTVTRDLTGITHVRGSITTNLRVRIGINGTIN